MQKFSLSKGFTLIELLVVIAILGILAAVVLIAINPAERIAEANDTQVRSDISTVASAVEACFTSKATGNYEGCNDVAELKAGGFLKSTPSTTINWSIGTDSTVTPAVASAEIKAYAELKATSARDDPDTDGDANTCTTSPVYYVYDTQDGDSYVQCAAPDATFAVL